MGPAVPGCARGRSHLGVWSWPHCGPTQQCTYILGGHTRSTVWSWAQLWRHGVVGTQLWVLWCVTCGSTHVAVVVCCDLRGAALRAKKSPEFPGDFYFRKRSKNSTISFRIFPTIPISARIIRISIFLKPPLSGRSLVKSALLGARFGSRNRRSFPRDSRGILERPRGRNSRRFPFRSFRSRFRIGARRRGARFEDFPPGRRKNRRRIRAGIRIL